MNVTKAADCTTLTITSDILTDYVGGDTVTLTVTYNCGTAVDLVVDTDITINVDDEVVLVPSDISQTTAFSDGVYRLVLTDSTNPTHVIETKNVYMFCEVNCDMITHYSKYKDSNIYAFHELLQQFGACDEFTYENSCLLWEEINNILEKPNTSGCGCD